MQRTSEQDSLQEGLIDTIRDVIEEIDIARDRLTEQAKDHINPNDAILTFSYSSTLADFFIEASNTIKFEVIVLETAPTFDGHKMA